MVPHLHDPANFVLILFFELLITKILSQVGGTGKDVNYHGNILLIDLGVLFVELLANEVSIFAATNLPK